MAAKVATVARPSQTRTIQRKSVRDRLIQASSDRGVGAGPGPLRGIREPCEPTADQAIEG